MGKLLGKTLALLAVLAFPGTALAEGFALYEYSARALALGGATMARTPDPSAVASNPALITRLPGTQIQAGVSVVIPSGHMDTHERIAMPSGAYAPGDGRWHLKDSYWPVPTFYVTHQINDRFTLGVGTFARYGLGFEYPENWPGRFNVYQVNQQTFSFNPNIAMAVTDKFSVAVGVEVMYLNLDLAKKNMMAMAPNYYIETNADINDASSVGLGANLGLHYQFNEQWAAGLSYRSQVRHRAVGDNTITTPAGSFTRKATGVVVLPDSLSGGVSFAPIPSVSLEAGFIWTRWSTFKSLDITTDGIGTAKSPKNWDDTWRLVFGVEWQALDWLALRAGYVYDQSPVTEADEDYLMPTDGRNIYSLGAGFSWNNWTADVAYAFIDAKGRSYESHPEHYVLRSTSKSNRTHVWSLSVGYKF